MAMTLDTKKDAASQPLLNIGNESILGSVDESIPSKQHPSSRYQAFAIVLLIICIPSELVFSTLLQSLIPHGGFTAVNLLAGQQQLVKLPTRFLKSARFDTPQFPNVQVSVFDGIPPLTNYTNFKTVFSDFDAVSLDRLHKEGGSGERYSTFAFYLLQGAELEVAFTLPVETPSQSISLSIAFLPDYTTATQQIFEKPSEWGASLPYHAKNLYEPRVERVLHTAEYTGYYLVHFIQASSGPWTADAGSIEITTTSRVFDTTKAIKSCAVNETCELKGKGHEPWQNALHQYVTKPESFLVETVVQSSCDFVVVRDTFPKAKRHFLVVSRKDKDASTRGVAALDANDAPLLAAFAAAFEDIKAMHPDAVLRAGFHAVPSMAHLHMHVISDDMVSPFLKNKKHWNSFTSRFFIPLEDVVEKIKEKGSIEINIEEYEQLLKGPLVCHKCKATLKNIPELKKHLEAHLIQQ
ncbi:hypothetical protein HDU98_002062 [Podochytrium sp. JEL0797]|nr:hypothetical protein HDU98_002062 [Podochytrium sp. JEL0797]